MFLSKKRRSKDFLFLFVFIYFHMFKFKTIPKHNFLDGSPFWKVSQREWGYVNEETGQINIPFDYVYTNENTQWTSTITTVDDFNAGITVNSPEGDIIFETNYGGVFNGDESLTTEERVREIFREEYSIKHV